jgi:hypothetical protein
MKQRVSKPAASSSRLTATFTLLSSSTMMMVVTCFPAAADQHVLHGVAGSHNQ